MKNVYLILALACLAVGAAIGHRFFPREIVREVPVTVTKEVVKTKEIVKFPSGKIVEREVVQTRDKTKASPQPKKPEYRAGILMPVGSERLPTVSASKRLFGDVWVDAQFNTRTHEALVGASVEF